MLRGARLRHVPCARLSNVPRGRHARAEDPAHIRDINLLVRRVFSPNLIKRLTRVPLKDRVLIKWMTIYKRLQPLGGNSEGNRVILYNSGTSAFSEMWHAIKNAKRRVDLETYILKPDAVGKQTLAVLTDAAKRGCSVTVLYDALGSMDLTEQTLAPLREAGGRAVQFNPLLQNLRPGLWGTLLSRNHRKILIVDNEIAFCGGMNIAKEYAGTELKGTGEFRDTIVKVEGPAVKDLEQVFLSSLDESGYLPQYPFKDRYHVAATVTTGIMKRMSEAIKHDKESMMDEWRRELPPVWDNTNSDADAVEPAVDEYSMAGVFVQVLQSNIRRNKRHIQKAFRVTLVDRCYVTTPYFLPPVGVKRALLQAAERDTCTLSDAPAYICIRMDVRVLTAGKSDVPIVGLASKHIYSVFLKRGVKIYELSDRVLHAKTVTADGIYGTIGSFNLDFWSSHRNLEVNLTVLDPEIANQIEEQFFEDLKVSREVTLRALESRSMIQKVLHWGAYQICRLVAFLPFWPKGVQHED